MDIFDGLELTDRGKQVPPKACPYNPVIVNGEVFLDSYRRKKSEQYKRLDFIDYKDNRILDIGCYNGYFAYEATQRGAVSYIGVDSNGEGDGLVRILDLAERVKESNNLTNVSFIDGECRNLHNLGINIDEIDIVTVLSIHPANELLDQLEGAGGEPYIPEWYNYIKTKVVYIEPTNHHKLTDDQWREKMVKANENTLNVNLEFLTFTDYQSRPLIKLTEKVSTVPIPEPKTISQKIKGVWNNLLK